MAHLLKVVYVTRHMFYTYFSLTLSLLNYNRSHFPEHTMNSVGSWGGSLGQLPPNLCGALLNGASLP